MVDSDDFVDGGSVDWSDVAGAFIGAILALVGYGAASGIFLVSTGIDRSIAGLSWFSSTLLGTPFEAGTGTIATAWDTFSESLGMFGPAAFPVAVVASIAVILVLRWGVRRLVR